MTPWRLAAAYLADRKLLTSLHVVMLALGVGTLVFLILFTSQAEDRLARDAKPVDLVVGAKGSPLQLILSAVFHADVPTGNIALAEAEKIAKHPMVASSTPLALGDSYRGYRIVGTDASYPALYEAKLAKGTMFAAEMQAVLGSEVARRQSLDVGAKLVGSHGLASSGPAHEDHPYQVAGILAPTGTVLDRVVLTSVESVWHVHEHAGASPGAGPEITALLIRYRTPLVAAMLPRVVNASTSLQAASPAYESARLLHIAGAGIEAMRWFAVVLMVGAAVSIFVALTSALQERRYDLALLRVLGARPASLALLAMAEGVTLLVAGVILGFVMGHAAVEILGLKLEAMGSWPMTGRTGVAQEAWLAMIVLGAGVVTCLLPAIQAYSTDPAKLLARR